MKDEGHESDKLYTILEADGTESEYPICKKFNNDTSSLSFLGFVVNFASFIIVLTSFIMRFIFIKMIGWIGLSRFSREAAGTMISVLIVSFFNYGVLYIVAPFNFRELGSEQGDLFSGVYTDYTA